MDFGEVLYTNLFIAKKNGFDIIFRSTVNAGWKSAQYFSSSSVFLNYKFY